MRIVVSRDRCSASVITDSKTYHIYHSDGKVIELVTEMVLEPINLQERSEEITEVLELQLTFKEIA
jgi:hypothetical protein